MNNTKIYNSNFPHNMAMPRLLDTICSNNHFVANGWAYETAEKYLYEYDSKSLEIGFYNHYTDAALSKRVKRVLELPTSYGCPMKCAYCASSWISEASTLSEEVLLAITDEVLKRNSVKYDDNLLISLTGAGDAFFTLDLILKYTQNVTEQHPNFCFTVSSCNWTKEMLSKIEDVSYKIAFRNIQSTYISFDQSVATMIIPGLRCTGFDYSLFVEHIKNSRLDNWRINYLLLHSVNDDDDSFERFVQIVNPIREKVLVRISSLNETIASTSSGLHPALLERSVALQNKLQSNGTNAYLFHSDINDNMSCGQLILERKHGRHM